MRVTSGRGRPRCPTRPPPSGSPARWSCVPPSRSRPAARSWRALGPRPPGSSPRPTCTCRSRWPGGIGKVGELRADGCVAVGGGSAIGLGKAIALEHDVPVIAVPTTYAGSEMTPVWGITEAGKRTGRDPRCCRRSVLYDPELTAQPARRALGHQRDECDGARRRGAVRPRRDADRLADGRGGRASARAGTTRSSPTAATSTPAASAVRGVAVRRGAGLDHHVAAPQALPQRSAARWTFRTPRPTRSSCRTRWRSTQPAAPAAVAAAGRALGGVPDPARELWDLAGRLGAPRSLHELGMSEADIALIAVRRRRRWRGSPTPTRARSPGPVSSACCGRHGSGTRREPAAVAVTRCPSLGKASTRCPR